MNPENSTPHPDAAPASPEAEVTTDLATIPAGPPQDTESTCVTLDAHTVLRATPRSFALKVHGQSMVGADIFDGDVVIGEFTPQAQPGHIVVALIDGEVALKRYITQNGGAVLISENPNHPDLIPLHELVIQGVVHTVVRRLR
jgi:SOS-response transcriptional repressor LexA